MFGIQLASINCPRPFSRSVDMTASSPDHRRGSGSGPFNQFCMDSPTISTTAPGAPMKEDITCSQKQQKRRASRDLDESEWPIESIAYVSDDFGNFEISQVSPNGGNGSNGEQHNEATSARLSPRSSKQNKTKKKLDFDHISVFGFDGFDG